MQVNDELIDKLSKLSMLEFEAEEREQIKKDLEKMIGFVDKLKELDTTGVEPLMHMSTVVNVLREDIPGEILTKEEALLNAPLHNESFFQVPKVINKNA
jgi:aspartyl-tRNA(Asn)/glutamyl-tRNA(Gln) amidotransferase subunit C